MCKRTHTDKHVHTHTHSKYLFMSTYMESAIIYKYYLQGRRWTWGAPTNDKQGLMPVSLSLTVGVGQTDVVIALIANCS